MAGVRRHVWADIVCERAAPATQERQTAGASACEPSGQICSVLVAQAMLVQSSSALRASPISHTGARAPAHPLPPPSAQAAMISRRRSTESAASFEDSPRVHDFGRAGSALSRSSSSMAAASATPDPFQQRRGRGGIDEGEREPTPGALFRERTSSGGKHAQTFFLVRSHSSGESDLVQRPSSRLSREGSVTFGRTPSITREGSVTFGRAPSFSEEKNQGAGVPLGRAAPTSTRGPLGPRPAAPWGPCWLTVLRVSSDAAPLALLRAQPREPGQRQPHRQAGGRAPGRLPCARGFFRRHRTCAARRPRRRRRQGRH
jgi:hypothetical protein